MRDHAIYSALCAGPLFLTDVPEARVFSRDGLEVCNSLPSLNLEQKLGHLYEDALAALLQASPRYTLLEQGLQLQKDRHQTVGELDFLLRDHDSGSLIHLELAVKFYLALPCPEKGLLLPGPNARDNYYKKLERMRSHQLTLIRRHRDLLPSQYSSEPIETRQLVIGCLFDHIDASAPALAEYMHPALRRGLWVRQSEFASTFSSAPEVIPKHLWPAALDQAEGIPLDLSIPLTRCTMVKVPGLSHPIFITPDQYPSQGA